MLVRVVSDSNNVFTSTRFKKFLLNCTIEQLLTYACNAQINGKVEKHSQSLYTRLKCKFNETTTLNITGTKYLNKSLMCMIISLIKYKIPPCLSSLCVNCRMTLQIDKIIIFL